MSAGIRSSNLPLGPLVEVIGNNSDGSLRRSTLASLADAVRGIVTSDPSGVAGVRADLTSLTNVVGGKAAQSDFLALQTTVGGKAAQTDLAAVQTALAAAQTAITGKAAQTDLTALQTALSQGLAAAQTANDTLGNTLSQSLTASLRGYTDDRDNDRKAEIAGLRQTLVESLTNVSAVSDAQGAALLQAIQQRDLAIDAVRNALVQSVTDSNKQISDLSNRFDASRYDYTASQRRPGEGPLSFALLTSVSQISGAYASLPVIPPGLLTISDDGPVVRLASPCIIAMRRAVAIEQDRTYRLTAALRRRANVADPSNDALTIGLAWLDQAGNLLASTPSTVVIDLTTLMVSNGRRVVRRGVGRYAGPHVDYVAPRGARAAILYAQSYASTGLTDIEVLAIDDVTDATLLDPISEDVTARVGQLESINPAQRLSALESAVQSPNSVTYATVSDATAATIPSSVTTLLTRGTASAGDGLGKTFRRVSSIATGVEGFTSQDGGKWQRYFDRTDRPSLLTFGSPVNGDWTQVVQNAAGSGAAVIFVPEGRYKTTLGAYDAANVVFVGPGKIVKADNTADAPHRAFLTAPVAKASDDRTQIFDGDVSKMVMAARNFVGPGVNPSTLPSVYTNYPEWSQTLRIFEFNAGFNKDKADHAKGRSGAFMDCVRMYFNGQGDLTQRNFFGAVTSSLPGSTHYLSNPAIAVDNGTIGAEGNATGAYLQREEFVFTDGGLSVAVQNKVGNYVRTNDDRTLDQRWGHDFANSGGSKPIDFVWMAAGRIKNFIDATHADLGTQQALIAALSGQRIYLDARPQLDSLPSLKPSEDLSNTYITYENGATKIVVGGAASLQVANSVVLSAVPFLSVMPGTAPAIPNGFGGFYLPNANTLAFSVRLTDGTLRYGSLPLSTTPV